MMHPKINYPGELAPIIADLASPLHARSRRDVHRSAHEATEVSLADGYTLDATRFGPHRHLDVVLEDMRRFMSVVMEVRENARGFPIRMVKELPESLPAGAAEAYRVRVSDGACEIAAADVAGLRRAIFFLEDEMLLRRAPILPRGQNVRWTRLGARITRSPIAPYRWLSGWELEDENDYYPDEYLNKIAHCGVNGIWVAGLLRNLVASSVIPQLGPKEHRLGKLRRLVEKASAYGIGVYFFCIEPRALPLGHPAGAAHPQILGAQTDLYSALCPSEPKVLEYLREATRSLFTEVPELAGIINIFCGERPTGCGWDEGIQQRCPRCAGRPRAQVLAAMLDAMAEGIEAAGSTADLIAWMYLIANRQTAPIAPMAEVMSRSRREIVWMGNFEHGGIKEVGGRRLEVHEYALSYIGPSDAFAVLPERARALGRRAYAKLQLGTTFEMSSVPYIPAPGIVYEKLKALGDLGIAGAMLNWIPGGFPSPMLKAAGEAAFEPRPPRDVFLRRLAGVYWGESRADRAAAAWERMGQAWQEYPFDLAVLYWGPVTRAPAYQLHLERESRTSKLYNFGLERTRQPQFFDDRVERWQGALPAQAIIDTFRSMAEQWRPAAADLDALAREAQTDDELRRQAAVAAAVRLQCLATADCYEFFLLRDSLLTINAQERTAVLQRMRWIAQQEIELAEQMKHWMEIEPSIGFHPELYAYSYSIPMLDEKIRQVRDLLTTLERWEREDVEAAVLRRTVDETERLRPERWGD